MSCFAGFFQSQQTQDNRSCDIIFRLAAKPSTINEEFLVTSVDKPVTKSPT